MGASSDNAWMPTVAGILDICAGISAIGGSLPVGFIALGMGSFALPARHTPGAEYPAGVLLAFFLILAAGLFVAGIISIIGGVHALQRRSRMWALAGSIGAVFGFFPLGIPAVILTVLSEGQFADSPARAGD
jgi:hypothetical protein